ncbi:histone methylation protein DOT1-domain-containing protein, partial [Mycena olivaceomarginata]
NLLMQTVNSWRYPRVPKAVLFHIIDECYQRCIGPSIPALKFEQGNQVYGELTPSILFDIFETTRLSQKNLFLDLGCGAGTALIQASLQTGCRSYGIEIREVATEIGKHLVREFLARCKMWGVSAGNVELETGDMLRSSRLLHLIREADVLLLNNRVFDAQLNKNIYDILVANLKDGAHVITLKTLGVSIHARSQVIFCEPIPFCITKHFCPPGSFSWTGAAGAYYLHQISRGSRSQFSDIQLRKSLPLSLIKKQYF